MHCGYVFVCGHAHPYTFMRIQNYICFKYKNHQNEINWYFLVAYSSSRPPWVNTPLNKIYLELGFPGGTSEESVCQCKRPKRHRFDSWMGTIPWRGPWQPAPVFLPGESHGQRSLVGYSPWSCKELDMTEWLGTHTKRRIVKKLQIKENIWTHIDWLNCNKRNRTSDGSYVQACCSLTV